jgi:LuxR family transcriptional regulator, quorum-sensing system regulator CciR
MLKGFDLDHFLDAMRDARDMADLEAIMVEMTGELGFEQFALGHHVDLLRPPANAVRLTNYNAGWIEQSLEQRLFADDPVHAASARLVRPFRWDEIPNYLDMTEPHRAIIERARGYGLVEGFTVPVHQPGEYNGTCSFSARSFAHLHPHSFALSQMAATFAFECARRLMRTRDGKSPEPVPRLTGRQLESLILVAQGKTDAEIAAVMRISRATAHDHVEAGRRAYGNAQRTYMVLRALYDGVITFADVFRR